MLVRNQKDVKGEAAPMPGVKGAYIQWLVAQPEGAGNFYMRRVTLEEGGLIPDHQHPEEHEIFVISGQGEVKSQGDVSAMNPGDAIFIPAGEVHSFTNVGQGELAFICCINAVKK